MFKFRPITRREGFTRLSAVIGGTLIAVALILNWQRLSFFPCPFRVWMNIPCPLCGLTRSFAAMLKLDLSTAFGFHPLGPLVFIVVVIMVAIVALSACFRLKPFLNLSLKWQVGFFLIGWIVKLIYVHCSSGL
jgi:hypothetical protein